MTCNEPGHDRYVKLAQILSNLDRCEHGRHHNDSCYSCRGSASKGNPFMPPGTQVGFDHGGNPIIAPDWGKSVDDPESWK